MPDAYIGVGSNLAQPLQQIHSALTLLAEHADLEMIESAAIYQTPALGDASQPDYHNTVVRITTALEPLQLLDCLQEIEQQRGRIRSPGRRWEARTIDLDMLLYGEELIQYPRLVVPHAEMLKRDFVMIPLLEIAPPDLMIPGFGDLKTCAEHWQARHLKKVADPVRIGS